LAQTKGAPFINAKFAAEYTGLGMTAIKRIGLRRFGNTDYVAVNAINAVIEGDGRPGPIPQTSLDSSSPAPSASQTI